MESKRGCGILISRVGYCIIKQNCTTSPKMCAPRNEGWDCVSGKTSRSECRKFPAMRCKIEKMKVMKKKPETKCERMPRQFCRKEECGGGGGSNDDPDLTSVTSIMDESLCYFRIQMVRHFRDPNRFLHPAHDQNYQSIEVTHTM